MSKNPKCGNCGSRSNKQIMRKPTYQVRMCRLCLAETLYSYTEEISEDMKKIAGAHPSSVPPERGV